MVNRKVKNFTDNPSQKGNRVVETIGDTKLKQSDFGKGGVEIKNTGRGPKVFTPGNTPYSVTFKNNAGLGQDTTLFGEAAKNVPRDLKGDNVQVNQQPPQQPFTPIEQVQKQQTQPQEVSLQPETSTLGKIPVLGKIIDSLRSTSTAFQGEGFDNLDEGTAREIALNEIRKKSYKKGISAGEKFGAFIEAIPIVGSAANKWARGLVETPSGNAADVRAEILSERERAATSAEKVRSGLISPYEGLEMAQQMENNIAELEGRIKLLISTSAILRTNSDEVNKIQEEVLRAKERVEQFRRSSELSLNENLQPGANLLTDEKLLLELQQINK